MAAPSVSLLTALPPGASLARSSAGAYFDNTGTLQSAAANQPRFGYQWNGTLWVPSGLSLVPARTNSIRNGSAGGAVVGTPGTLPTNWFVSFGAVTGLSRQVVATGTEGGLPYVDIRAWGTASNSGFVQIAFEATTTIAAAQGQTWVGSAYHRLISGALPGSFNLTVAERDASGTSLLATTEAKTAPTNAALTQQRSTITRTITSAGAARFTVDTRVMYVNGATFDFTLRVAAPQLEQIVSGPSLPSASILTTNAAVTRAAEALTLPWPGVADGPCRLRTTFDDGSSQLLNTAISGGASVIAAPLNRLVVAQVDYLVLPNPPSARTITLTDAALRSATLLDTARRYAEV